MNYECGYDGGDCLNQQFDLFENRKYFLLRLDSIDTSKFVLERSKLLGTLGQIFKSMIRISIEDETKQELIEDISGTNGMKVRNAFFDG